MTQQLSPAAQAVRGAVGWQGTSLEREAQNIAAAALRAAADQAAPEKQVEDIQYAPQTYTDGMRDALAVLQKIADELEAQ